MKRLILLFTVAVSFGWMLQKSIQSVQAQEAEPMLRAAIFVQNRAGAEFDENVPTFRDFIANKLTSRGFSIIDQHDVVTGLKDHASESKDVRNAISAVLDYIGNEGGTQSIEDALVGASALRIAQMMGADYLVIASIASFGSEKRTFTGTGQLTGLNSKFSEYSLRLGIKVLEGNEGGSVYGDIVSVTKKIPQLASLQIDNSDLLNGLLDNGSSKIVENIGNKMDSIRTAKVDTIPMVEFTVKSNVPGASIAIDNVVIGSAPGTFLAKPGLHTLSVTKDWHSSWKRTVNIVPNQVFDINLELSEAGLARKTEVERQQREDELTRKYAEAEIDIAREQSEAQAHSQKAVADGQKTFLENSNISVNADIEF